MVRYHKKGKYGRRTPVVAKVDKLIKDVNNLKKSDQTKYHDEASPRTGILYNANNASVIADPAVGTTTQTRIGDSISPYFCEVRGLLESATNGTATSQMRIMLIQSKQGFVPQTNSINTTSGVLALANSAQAVNSQWLHENRPHFTVKYDRTFMFDASNNAFGTGNHKFHIKAKISRGIKFGEGLSTAESGMLYLLFFSDTSASIDAPVASWASRVSYKD